MLKNHVLGSFNLNNSEKYRLSFEDIFLGILEIYTKKNKPTLDNFFFGGGVRGEVCWLIAYYVNNRKRHVMIIDKHNVCEILEIYRHQLEVEC